MTFPLFLQLLTNGLVVGALLAIVALGVALIFGVVRVVNFAHGEFVTLGAFATYLVVTQLNVSPLLGIPLAFLLGAAVGAGIQAAIVSRAAGRPELDVLMVTYALSIIGLGIFSSVFGGDFRSYSEGPSGTLSLGSVVIGLRSLTVLLVCLVVGAGTILVVQRTRIGLALRALAQSRDSAAACGINVPAAELFAFALAVGLASAAGALVSLIGTVHPRVGHDLVLDAFVVVVLGGMGSIGGAVLAAIAIGVVNAFTSFAFDDSWARILTYCLLYATLLLRPQGLLGRHVGA
ncbi:branched-chain amino acid ABC transporter permease [Micromonospora sp. STR1s_5]|nr:branched-chain amino acid ABC transporter permease [Micromonospora sp. STR1s_5]